MSAMGQLSPKAAPGQKLTFVRLASVRLEPIGIDKQSHASNRGMGNKEAFNK